MLRDDEASKEVWFNQTPTILSTHQSFQEAQKQGFGEENIAALAKLYL